MHKERLQIHNNKEQEHFVIFNLNDDIDDNDIQEGSLDFQKQGEGGGCHLLIKKFHCKFVFILRLRKRQHFVKQCNIFFLIPRCIVFEHLVFQLLVIVLCVIDGQYFCMIAIVRPLLEQPAYSCQQRIRKKIVKNFKKIYV